MHPNERDANKPKQLWSKWDGMPIPEMPSLVQLATSCAMGNAAIKATQPKNQNMVRKGRGGTKIIRPAKNLENTLSLLPFNEAEAVDEAYIERKAKCSASAANKRLCKLIAVGKVARIKRGIYYYWRIDNVQP